MPTVLASLTKTRRVREATITLTFADSTALRLFPLPANVRLIAWHFNVQIAFNGSSPTLDIGLEGDTDYIVKDQASLGTIGQVVPTTGVLKPGYETGERPIGIYGLLKPDGSTAGSVDVTCFFSYLTDRRV